MTDSTPPPGPADGPNAPDAWRQRWAAALDGSASDTPKGAELDAFVGPNAAYYRRQWSAALGGEAGGIEFNWVAFLFAGLWLPYRRLYGHAFALYGLFLAVDVIAAIIEGPAPRPGTALAVNGFYLVSAIVAGVAVGACANGWYLSRFRRAVADAHARGLAEGEHLRALARLGGTDLVALFAFPIASAALSALVRIVLVGPPGF